MHDDLVTLGAAPTLTTNLAPSERVLCDPPQRIGAQLTEEFGRAEMLTTTRSILEDLRRLVGEGRIHGPDQRISPLEALKASTINAAYQYFEERTKGSLEVGKLADMVILSDNPLKVAPLKIRDIEVIETIKEGITIYRK